MNKKVLIIGLGVLALGAGAYFIIKDKKDKDALAEKLQGDLEDEKRMQKSRLDMSRAKAEMSTRLKETSSREAARAEIAALKGKSYANCPSGMKKYGDGSACVSTKNSTWRCALYGNASLGRCYCPDGMTEYGDGSACVDKAGIDRCAKWGNDKLRRCS
jgi:hypothetical protein